MRFAKPDGWGLILLGLCSGAFQMPSKRYRQPIDWRSTWAFQLLRDSCYKYPPHHSGRAQVPTQFGAFPPPNPPPPSHFTSPNPPVEVGLP